MPDLSKPESVDYRKYIADIARQDAERVLAKDEAYGASWKKRGGSGAFMNLARKMDRLDHQARKKDFNIFLAIQEDDDPVEGLIDTLRDLRGYALLIEAELIAHGVLPSPVKPKQEYLKPETIHCPRCKIDTGFPFHKLSEGITEFQCPNCPHRFNVTPGAVTP